MYKNIEKIVVVFLFINILTSDIVGNRKNYVYNLFINKNVWLLDVRKSVSRKQG